MSVRQWLDAPWPGASAIVDDVVIDARIITAENPRVSVGLVPASQRSRVTSVTVTFDAPPQTFTIVAGHAPVAAAPAPTPEALRIRGYRVLRLTGAGGMATAYEAQQERPDRTVALKILNRALAKTSALHRFEFETEVLGRLQTPRCRADL